MERDQIDRAIRRRSYAKCWVDDESRVPTPVDVTNPVQFPNINEAARYAREKGLV